LFAGLALQGLQKISRCQNKRGNNRKGGQGMIVKDYSKINARLFVHEWNNGEPSSELKVRYGLGTVVGVNNYVRKLRHDGIALVRRKKARAR
jgi:hypothetical protein